MSLKVDCDSRRLWILFAFLVASSCIGVLELLHLHPRHIDYVGYLGITRKNTTTIANDSTSPISYVYVANDSTSSMITCFSENPKISFSVEVPKSGVKEAKYLFYKCDAGCGGIGDRLRGIFNSFALALITGRVFGIRHPKPCPLVKFFKPNKYKWNIDERSLGKKSSKIYDIMSPKKLFSRNMTEYFKEDVVHIKSNGYMIRDLRMQVDVPRRAPWLTKFTYADIYRTLLSHLFLLDESLQNKLHEFRRKFVQNNRTICAHFRAGKNPTMPRDDNRDVGHIELLWKFFSSYDKVGNVFYIATDSQQIKDVTKSKFPNKFINIPGKIVHTDLQRDDSECSGFRTAVLEHRFLSECDVIVMSESGFGRSAGYLRAHSEDMFCLQTTGILPCSRSTLPDILPGYTTPQSWHTRSTT